MITDQQLDQYIFGKETALADKQIYVRQLQKLAELGQQAASTLFAIEQGQEIKQSVPHAVSTGVTFEIGYIHQISHRIKLTRADIPGFDAMRLQFGEIEHFKGDVSTFVSVTGPKILVRKTGGGAILRHTTIDTTEIGQLYFRKNYVSYVSYLSNGSYRVSPVQTSFKNALVKSITKKLVKSEYESDDIDQLACQYRAYFTEWILKDYAEVWAKQMIEHWKLVQVMET